MILSWGAIFKKIWGGIGIKYRLLVGIFLLCISENMYKEEI